MRRPASAGTKMMTDKPEGVNRPEDELSRAIQRAIDFGIDPTLTLYNLTLTPAERFRNADRSISEVQRIANNANRRSR